MIIGVFIIISKGLERRVANRRKNRDHPDHSTGKIGQNIKKNPGSPRRLAVTCCILTTIMISMTTVLQIHIQMQSNANAGESVVEARTVY